MTGLLAWIAYSGVRGALETEFGRRLETLARTAASQVSPADLRDAQLLGEDGNGYLALQVLLEEMRSSTGLVSAAALDSAGAALYDTRGAERHGETSPLDTLAHQALAEALAGTVRITPAYRVAGHEVRAGLAPVHEARRVIGAIAVEARVDYLEVLAGFRRTLLLATLLSALGIAVLALVIIRVVGSAARLERRLSRAENLAAMGRLTATLAHEIKNPLAIIRGSAERLGRADPEVNRMAEFVIEETDRLSRTVARYLQFARGTPEPAAAEAGDAVAALEATLDLLEGELASRGTVLERAGPFPAAAPVALDNESLKQLYLNLMLNALEAMERGGRLRVAAAERGARYEVSIADSGPGVAPDVLKRLGSPFFTTKPAGSGLGLFLAQRLAQSAGGELRITSQPGEGTTCLVRLPKRRG